VEFCKLKRPEDRQSSESPAGFLRVKVGVDGAEGLRFVVDDGDGNDSITIEKGKLAGVNGRGIEGGDKVIPLGAHVARVASLLVADEEGESFLIGSQLTLLDAEVAIAGEDTSLALAELVGGNGDPLGNASVAGRAERFVDDMAASPPSKGEKAVVDSGRERLCREGALSREPLGQIRTSMVRSEREPEVDKFGRRQGIHGLWLEG
jgi:hypothetical protein